MIVRVVVEDNGPGIERKYLGKIFQKFLQDPIAKVFQHQRLWARIILCKESCQCPQMEDMGREQIICGLSLRHSDQKNISIWTDHTFYTLRMMWHWVL